MGRWCQAMCQSGFGLKTRAEGGAWQYLGYTSNSPSSQCLFSQLRSWERLELDWAGTGDGPEKTGRGQIGHMNPGEDLGLCVLVVRRRTLSMAWLHL